MRNCCYGDGSIFSMPFRMKRRYSQPPIIVTNRRRSWQQRGVTPSPFRFSFAWASVIHPRLMRSPTTYSAMIRWRCDFTPEDVRTNSPKSLSLVELRSPRDLVIFRKIYDHSIRIGDNAPGWEITYAREFDMTNDSRLFPPLDQWEAKGYKPDVFGRWIGPEGDVALPLYQGGMINHFDVFSKMWLLGLGRSAAWASVPCDNKRPRSEILDG